MEELFELFSVQELVVFLFCYSCMLGICMVVVMVVLLINQMDMLEERPRRIVGGPPPCLIDKKIR